ncbi:hypothetical protein IEU95_11680 [Hoyosella rhizosphaerae]|uniref:Anti-sigma-M factor RsmA n=1 Tax=Hoyosella rhizosphaerae TaxID=1755582 RepID=A0A916U826_9ACTN|nr:hypothetical protein [Hoyosella rhizosphaerae]MBN4927493.1 hypothetical protein [Hoyosella rhizosphaerae]GGC64035.1 hypothetical protein GCM10011410_15630 [Hoyosella rhizosphaerae]
MPVSWRRHHSRSDGGPPEPPYSPELVADLHAGLLSPSTEQSVRSRLHEDTEAQDLLRALDVVHRELDALAHDDEGEDLPPELAASIDSMFAPNRPDNTVVSIGARRIQSSRRAIILAAASVAAVFAAVATLLTVEGIYAEPRDSVRTEALIDRKPEIAAERPLGFRGGSSALIAEPQLSRCLSAHGFSSDAQLLGVVPIEEQVNLPPNFSSDEKLARIVVADHHLGGITSLVVGINCDLDRPSLVSRTTVGNR